jgi:heavy metal translocating P-type ATPase
MNMREASRRVRPLLVAFPAIGLAVGLLLRFRAEADWAHVAFSAATIPVLAALLVEIVTSLRDGEVGLDIVAALSMGAALAFGESLAACVVAMMYAGGQYLESFAEGRARREMQDLLSRAPRSALLRRDGKLVEVALEEIAPGDTLLIRHGDVVPVDGGVVSATALLDESALTGEAMPVRHARGATLMSGSTNAGDAFDMKASRTAQASTYAGIVRLVEQAQRSRAPMARLADRYALVFLAVTVAIAAAAWLATGDPIRAVAVLVVATPCPLILAVPVALVSGLSRAAGQGVLIKGAKFLEGLARIRTVIVDKTGTLTDGRPQLAHVELHGGFSQRRVLQLAASLDQASKHVIAQAIVAEARQQGIELLDPSGVSEKAGEGVTGAVDGRRVTVGGLKYVLGVLKARRGNPRKSDRSARDHAPGTVSVAVAVENRLAGVLVLADRLRPDTARLLGDMRALGVERIVLATGDRGDIARSVAEGLPIDSVRSELTPDGKVLVVLTERKNGPVMMIGDGVNDAPALAAADIGVAMGARGAAASSEAADVVLLVDHLDRILPGMKIARGARAIALQSVYAGIGLSLAGMIAAALGHITPVQGALLQEAIDVAVILNALRVLRLRPVG